MLHHSGAAALGAAFGRLLEDNIHFSHSQQLPFHLVTSSNTSNNRASRPHPGRGEPFPPQAWYRPCHPGGGCCGTGCYGNGAAPAVTVTGFGLLWPRGRSLSKLRQSGCRTRGIWSLLLVVVRAEKTTRYWMILLAPLMKVLTSSSRYLWLQGLEIELSQWSIFCINSYLALSVLEELYWFPTCCYFKFFHHEHNALCLI